MTPPFQIHLCFLLFLTCRVSLCSTGTTDEPGTAVVTPPPLFPRDLASGPFVGYYSADGSGKCRYIGAFGARAFFSLTLERQTRLGIVMRSGVIADIPGVHPTGTVDANIQASETVAHSRRVKALMFLLAMPQA